MRLALLLAALLVTAAVGVENAVACSCVPPDARELLARADAGLVGTVVDGSGFDDLTARVRVERAFKADLGDEVEIDTGEEGNTCNLNAAMDERVGLVLYRGDGGGWEAGLCDRVDPEQLSSAARGLERGSARAPARGVLVGALLRATRICSDLLGGRDDER